MCKTEENDYYMRKKQKVILFKTTFLAFNAPLHYIVLN